MLRSITRSSVVALVLIVSASPALDAQKPREQDLKLPIGGTPGPLDAITDVAGVEVGHTTLISGSGKLVVGQGPVRTGVTVIHPRGKANSDPVFAAWFTLNGNGEMTGTTWVQESGLLEGPVAVTNTHSVGVVRDTIIKWEVSQKTVLQPWWLPVVAETYDGALNDINGFHVRPEHVIAALDGAAIGLPQEGAVGGGTGMVCHGFKGGIGTASRRLSVQEGGYTVGVLVQCNYGLRRDLRIAGVPVGEEIPDLVGCIAGADPLPAALRRQRPAARQRRGAGLDHRRRRDRRAAVAASAETDGDACVVGRGTAGRVRRQQLGGYFHRLLDRERSCLVQRSAGDEYPDASQRTDLAAVSGDGPGDRGGDHERLAGRGNDDRRE
jgi:D-aminopeptidase